MEKTIMKVYINKVVLTIEGNGNDFRQPISNNASKLELAKFINNNTKIDEFIIIDDSNENERITYYGYLTRDKIKTAYVVYHAVSHLITASNVNDTKPSVEGYSTAPTICKDELVNNINSFACHIVECLDDDKRENYLVRMIKSKRMAGNTLTCIFNRLSSVITDTTASLFAEYAPEALMSYYRELYFANRDTIKLNTYRVYGMYLKSLRYTNITSIAKISKMNYAENFQSYDSSNREHVKLWDANELNSLIEYVDTANLVKSINKHITNKSMKNILQVIEQLFGDQFPWDKLDDAVMDKYYPKGLTTGSYTRAGKIKEATPSELSSIVYSFGGNSTTFFMALGLEKDEDKLDHLCQQCARAIKQTYNDNMFANNNHTSPYYLQNFNIVANYFEEGLLSSRLAKVMEYVILLLESDNNQSQYKRFMNWYRYAQIEKMCTVKFSKTLKKLSMEKKLS